LAPRQHLLGGEQHEPALAERDCGSRELEARHLAVRIRDLDLGERGAGLASLRARDRERRELRVFGGDQVGERLAGELRGTDAGQRREGLVGGLDAFAVKQCGLAQRREHGAHGFPARIRVRRRFQAHDLPPLPPGEHCECGSQHRQRDGGGRHDRHLACHPLRIRGPRDRQFRLHCAALGSISHA
jgi:hypothetical protein